MWGFVPGAWPAPMRGQEPHSSVLTAGVSVFVVARTERFELPTLGFEARRSDPLS
jgi:hypothetical protein